MLDGEVKIRIRPDVLADLLDRIAEHKCAELGLSEIERVFLKLVAGEMREEYRAAMAMMKAMADAMEG